MKLSVEIKQDFDGTIAITDYTKNPEFGQYLDEDGVEFSQGFDHFKYSKTISIAVLKYEHGADDDLTTLYYKHTELPSEDETADSIRIPITRDGYYTVHYLVLPTLDWLEEVVTAEENLDESERNLPKYNHIYITDGCGILKYNTENSTAYPVEIEEVLQINSCYSEDYKGTISKSSFDLFSIALLRQCYIDISKQLFDKCPSNCDQLDSSIRFKRDFIWMTLNVINFYLQDNMYIDAQNVLEETMTCNSFCRNISQLERDKGGCGCHR